MSRGEIVFTRENSLSPVFSPLDFICRSLRLLTMLLFVGANERGWKLPESRLTDDRKEKRMRAKNRTRN